VTIGVFDSGVGGKSVAWAIQRALPEHGVIYAEDRENIPYGLKTPNELNKLVTPILLRMREEGCNVIVIACNTVTTTIIGDLRERLEVPLVGIEPMIKPAAQLSKSNIISVCATPTTLDSKRYKQLIAEHGTHLEIIEPDCSDWAYMIEHDEVDNERIRQTIRDVCRRGADVIVLGCTHYHWIQEEISNVASKFDATVIQPEQAIISRLRQVLQQLG
jgi:glutamate racemase